MLLGVPSLRLSCCLHYYTTTIADKICLILLRHKGADDVMH